MKFIVRHINDYDTVFYTRVEADDAESAKAVVAKAHTDNIVISAVEETETPAKNPGGGHVHVVDLALES